MVSRLCGSPCTSTTSTGVPDARRRWAYERHSCRPVGGCAVVEHRVDEQLASRLLPSLVVQPLDETGRQATAGALASDDHPVGVDTQARSVGREPVPRCMHVVGARREGVLGRQPVAHRDDSDAQVTGDAGRADVVLLSRPDHQPAAVDPQQRR